MSATRQIHRERQLVDAFVTVADSLVRDYDLIGLLQSLVDRSIGLFDASAAGIVLGSATDGYEVVASTSERSQFVGLMQLRADEGPCVEAITTGRVVSVESPDEIRSRWPLFASASQGLGFVAVHAIPLRLRDDTIGSLNLFRDREGELNGADAVAAQALADVATISILQERAVSDLSVTKLQLQKALDSRVLIEQAKGVVAHTHDLDMEAAYRLIRHQARTTQTKIAELARAVVEDGLVLELTEPPKADNAPARARTEAPGA